MASDSYDIATRRAKKQTKSTIGALAAHYDRRLDRVVVNLRSGFDLAFDPHRTQGLEKAAARNLNPIEISPSGFGLYFPKLDADIYLPALLEGAFGSKRWIASHLGARGGAAKSPAKAKAARANGSLGGRPTAIAR